MQLLEDNYQLYNQKLGFYFKTQALGPGHNWTGNYRRGFSELVYHFIQAKEWHETETILTDFTFLMEKSKQELTEGILEDYQSLYNCAPQNNRNNIEIWNAFFRERINILRRGNSAWPACKILFQLAIEQADDSPITMASEKYLSEGKIKWTWLRRERRIKHLIKNQCLLTFEGHKKSLSNVILLSNNNILSWAGDFKSTDYNIRIWNKENGACLNILEGHTSEVHKVVELSNSHLLSCSADKTIRLWDKVSGNCLNVLVGHTDSIYNLILLSNGNILSLGGKTMCIWNITSGKCLKMFNGHTGDIFGAKELSNGQILSWAEDKTLRSWNQDNAKCLNVFKGHSEWVSSAFELSNGMILSSACGHYNRDPITRIWNKENGRCIYQLEGNDAIELINGNILTWSEKGSLKIWSKEDGKCLAVNKKYYKKIIGAIELTNGNILAWTNESYSPNVLLVWNKKSEDSVIEFEGHTDYISGAVELSNGRILSWSHDNTMRLWDENNGACLSVLRGHTSWIHGIHKLPNNKILSWSSDNLIKIWDTTVIEGSDIIEGHDDNINGTIELSNGRILSWSYDKTLRIWDSKNGTCIKVLKGHIDPVGGAIELANKRILSWPNWIGNSIGPNDGKTLFLWDCETGNCIATLKGHTSSIANAIELSDGRILSWARFIDKNLRIWDSKSGDCLAVLEGHEYDIRGALELSDGRILSWATNGPLRMWDKRTGRCVLIFEGNDDSWGTLEKVIELSNGMILYWVIGSKARDDYNLFRLVDNRNGEILASFEWDQTKIDGAIELSDGIILSCSNSATFRIWDTNTGESLEVLDKHDLFKRQPDKYIRFYELPNLFNKYFAHSKEYTVLLEPNLCQWEAESLCSATNLSTEGSLVITQKNGQVCFLKLYKGKLPVSFKEL